MAYLGIQSHKLLLCLIRKNISPLTNHAIISLHWNAYLQYKPYSKSFALIVKINVYKITKVLLSLIMEAQQLLF